MSKFVVLDPSLRGVGQHNFEYDVHVLRAAERQGWQPVLAAHRDLGRQHELIECWEIHRAFGDHDHERILHQLHRCRRRLAKARATASSIALAKRCESRFNRWRYQRRYAGLTHGYRTAMDRIWSGCRLAHGDQIFLATAMPWDIAGLADWARDYPGAREVDWHLQFHFPLVDAETWYADASRQYAQQLMDLPQMLQELLAALGRARVHLYATTPALANQLAHCLGEPFATLPLPTNPALARLRAGVAERSPLRAICAGQPRLEKGGEHWSHIVSELTADYFASGRLQLGLQAQSYAELPEPLRRLVADLAAPDDRRPARTPVALAGWPLSPAGYVEFLASSSMGLLMYDPLAYHARISGVMADLLGAGVPVIVPAGCALADQIAEPIFAHQEQLRERLSVVANVGPGQLEWKVAMQHSARRGITVGVDTPCATIPAVVAQTEVPAHASHLLVLVDREEPNAWNRYCSVSTLQRAGRWQTAGAQPRHDRLSRLGPADDGAGAVVARMSAG